ncbi:hypothetical protein ACODT3_01700 [Streptomyces sp. 4.24]|uniref:hypothetical protein n=1 Tax=Streptomyces tritrimontium TaxID=3406573 RepID=UPI003BB4EEF3
MKDAGADAGTLGEPRTAVDERLRQAGQDPAGIHAVAGVELKLSKADADCQVGAGLAAAVAAAQGDAEQTLGADHANDLAALRTVRQKALALAQAQADRATVGP